MARAVIFDVGQVLFRWDMRLLFAKLITDTATLDHFCSSVITEEWHAQHDAGRPLADMVEERTRAFPDHVHAIQAYAERFNETIPGPVEGMIDLVEELHRADVPLFVITNFGDEFWQKFRPTQPIFDRFRGILVSGTERLIKPDPAIYRLALSRFGLEARETLFIDDREENIAGAESVGIAGHIFRNAMLARAWLLSNGTAVAASPTLSDGKAR